MGGHPRPGPSVRPAAATQAWASHCTRPRPPARRTRAPPHWRPAVGEVGVRRVGPNQDSGPHGGGGAGGLRGEGRRPYAFHLALREDAGEHHHAQRHREDEDEGEGQGGGCGHDSPEQGQAEQLQGGEQVHPQGPDLQAGGAG